jgi:hypothetical protein
VILDDALRKTKSNPVNIPNSNVYYEYGLMTALGKYVIPLQKEGQVLAFNIQTHDTIKYAPQNISSELDAALKDAIRITQEDSSGQEYPDTSERFFIRCFEISGYQRKDYDWFLGDTIRDTAFSGFGHPSKQEYLFVTISNDKKSVQNAVTDRQVITRRLESLVRELSGEIDSYATKTEELNIELSKLEKGGDGKHVVGMFSTRSQIERTKRSLQEVYNKKNEALARVEAIQNSKFAIILTPQIAQLKDKVLEQFSKVEKDSVFLPLYVGDISGIKIGDESITFSLPTL